MASLDYLWKNRKKVDVLEPEFMVVWAKRFLTFPTLYRRYRKVRSMIKKGAHINESAEIGEVKINGKLNNLSIGAYSFIGRAEIALHDQIYIGEKVCISDGVKLLTGTHDIEDPQWELITKPIIIESNVWIAESAIILPGVHLGKGAVVGAGAVVRKNVDPYTVVVGNPARPVRKRRYEVFDYNPCQFLAGNSSWLNGK
ncbi:acyltransferase [Gramella sp. BOM4]|nr:acyltransferase [Christiangramia bathymodioli]